jgi:glycosyltransferase involved in cell wall biosynthesis
VTVTRILILIDDPQLPSARVSALQFVELMRGAGMEVDVAAFRAPELLRRQERVTRTATRMRMSRVARPVVARMQRLHEEEIFARAAAADLVYVIKVPRIDMFRRLARLEKPKLLFHVSDAFWLPFLQQHGWDDADEMLRLADGVTTTNEFTAARIRAANPKVFIVPDCPQVEDFDRMRVAVTRDSDEVTIGWIGTPLTANALFRIWEPLERLAVERADWSLRLVGTGSVELAANIPRFERVRWSALPWYDQETMIREVLAMDIGLFPLWKGDDALSRGSLKTLIYMSGGAASVSQAYGDNLELVQDGVNGMLADGDDQWLDKLRRLIDDRSLRASIAEQGLATVRRDHTRAAIFDALRHAIESV